MSSDSASSEVTYTSISSHRDPVAWAVNFFGLQEPDSLEAAPASPNYVPGPEEVPVEDQPYVIANSPIALSPGYVADLDPEEDSEDGPVDYLAEGGDGDDDDSSNNDEGGGFRGRGGASGSGRLFGNQSIERDRLIGIGLVMDLVKFLSFTFGGKEMTFVVLALSKRKFVIVCHEKVVRIPLEGDEILRVHGERTQGVMKTLMNTKRQVEFRIDLVHGATLVAKSPYRLASLEMQELSEQFQELQDEGVKDKILATPSETSKVENTPAEMLCDLDQQMEKRADNDNSKEWNSGDDQLRLRWMIYLVVLADAAEKTLEDIMRACVINFGGSYHLTNRCAPFEALYGRKCRSHVLWAEIRESSLTGLELVQETIDKFVLERRVRLAPRYVGPFKILERIGLVAYRLRLSEELNSVHDTFHVSNLKKCLADANLHIPLDEIKVDKTLRFVEEPVEIMDREI
ncbi:hypothetical protein Tco_0523158 [Tanacetum coccineum]